MYPVVFRNRKRADIDKPQYNAQASKMERFAAEQQEFLSFKSYVAEDGEVVSLSEWQDETSACAWGEVAEHIVAKMMDDSAGISTTRCSPATTPVPIVFAQSKPAQM